MHAHAYVNQPVHNAYLVFAWQRKKMTCVYVLKPVIPLPARRLRTGIGRHSNFFFFFFGKMTSHTFFLVHFKTNSIVGLYFDGDEVKPQKKNSPSTGLEGVAE